MTTEITTPTPSGPTDRRAEAPLTLDEPPARTLRLSDHFGMWANLGVSVLGFTGAIYVLNPLPTGAMSVGFAVLAIVVGTVIGTLMVGLAAIPGAREGAPSMVLLRGLFGARASYLPTAVNVVQLLGWTVFELVVIGAALHRVAASVPQWVFVLAGGIITTALALRPLGFIRTLRKYVTVAVVVAMVWLLIHLLRSDFPHHANNGAAGFWLAVDTVVGVSVSWVPLIADYTRHAQSARQAFWGSFLGYSITQIACYGIGLIALLSASTGGDDGRIFDAFLAVPLGTVAFGIIVIRELDQSFADTYSTAVSLQNVAPKADRRVLAVVLGTVATVLALALNINDYQNFLVLIGSVFTPMLGVLVVDYFVLRRQWDLSITAPTRIAPLVAWLVGFVVYQLINPGYVSWWVHAWTRVRSWIGFTPQTWMSASLLSFAAAALSMLVLHLLTRRSSVPAATVGS